MLHVRTSWTALMNPFSPVPRSCGFSSRRDFWLLTLQAFSINYALHEVLSLIQRRVGVPGAKTVIAPTPYTMIMLRRMGPGQNSVKEDHRGII